MNINVILNKNEKHFFSFVSSFGFCLHFPGFLFCVYIFYIKNNLLFISFPAFSLFVLYFQYTQHKKLQELKKTNQFMTCFLGNTNSTHMVFNRNLEPEYIFDKNNMFLTKIPTNIDEIGPLCGTGAKLVSVFESLKNEKEFFVFEKDLQLENKNFIRVKGYPILLKNEQKLILELIPLKYSEYGEKNFLKNLLDFSTDPILILSDKFRFKYANTGFLNLYQLEKQILGKSLTETGFTTAKISDKAFSVTFNQEQKTWYKISSCGGDLMMVVKTQTQDLNTDLVNLLPFGCFVVDEKWNIILINKPMQDLCSKNLGGKMPMNFLSFVMEKEKPRLNSEINKIKYGETFTYNMKLGEDNYIQLFLVNQSTQFERKYYGFIFNNIELQKSEKNVLHLQRLVYLGQLIVQILHDIANNLTAALGFCDVLCEKIREKIESEASGDQQKISGTNLEDQRNNSIENNLRERENNMGVSNNISNDQNKEKTTYEYKEELPKTENSFFFLMKVKHNICRAANLCRRLLSSAKKEAFSPSVKDMNSTIKDLAHTIKRLIGEKFNFDFDLSPEIKTIDIDETSFDQVVENIILNAKDSMENSGTITIKTGKTTIDEETAKQNLVIPGDYSFFSVQDTGNGIPKENIDKIFDPFFTTKEDKGTGMGLYTVKSIVKENGGFIKINSTVGKGSEFIIFFPSFIKTTNETLTFKDEPLNVTSLETRKNKNREKVILFVEDDMGIQEFVQLGFKNYSYNVFAASSAEEALLLVEKENLNNINVVITDIMLPGVSGHVFVTQLGQKLKNNNFPVIFTSGYKISEQVDDNLGTKSGYSNNKKIFYLSKPYSFMDLLDITEKATET